ncbi:MAG: protein kinase domain-containing protein [Gemmatimonadales bacterium]
MTHTPSRLCAVCGVVVPASFRFCPSCSSAISAEPSEAERQREALGAALGPQFDIHERIGRGGFGLVFRATDHALERQVAVKVLRCDLADARVARVRFLWGAQAMVRIEHPHIMRIYDVREAGALAFIVMPLVEGESLAAVLLREGRLKAREAARILAEAAEALWFVHETGFVHRDIKPQHIMLHGPERRVMLIDFSLCLGHFIGRQSGIGVVVGTPAYMSPELAEGRGDVDGRSDLYSLGVVGYQMITGELPFEGTAERLMVGHRTRLPRNPAVRHPDVPVDLAEVVMRCLAKLPQNRWADASELLAALHRLGERAAASPAAPSARAVPPARTSYAIGVSVPASPTAPAAVATPPSHAALGTPAVSLPRAGTTASTVRVTRSPAPLPQGLRLRNAPLWAAAAIVVLIVGYCALQGP